MMRLLIVCCLIMALGRQGISQGLEGQITNHHGVAVPYASIFVPALHKGTTANEKGFYILPLAKGDYQVVFQYLGYKSLTVPLLLDESFQQVNVVLQPQEYMLPEVIITASGEDPAYYVMRKAIGMSQYYRNQLSSYSAGVYLKGSGKAIKIPSLLKGQLKKEGIEEGKYYVTETISDILYEKGKPLQTKVHSVRSSMPGGDSGPMQFFTLSLYNDNEGIITPLSKEAFAVYRFQLVGTFLEDNHTIHKIKVIPKRKGNDLYSGSIFIREGSWSLHSVQLSLSQNLFDATINQVYQEVYPMVWLPVSHDYDLKVSLMGTVFALRYLVSLSNCKITLNDQLDHAFYAAMAQETQVSALPEQEKETSSVANIVPKTEKNQERIAELIESNNLSNKEMRELNQLIRMEAKQKDKRPSLEIKARNTEIADSAKVRTPDYWRQNRPVPLSDGEYTSFPVNERDKKATDTTKNRKFINNLNNLLSGTTYTLKHNWEIKHNGLIGLNALEFNTVDGFTYLQQLKIKKTLQPGHSVALLADGAYAFAREKMMGELGVDYAFAPLQRGLFSIQIGSMTRDFNADDGLAPFFNSITSLFFKQNIIKLYQEEFVDAKLQYDIVNGLEVKLQGRLSNRTKLLNNTNYFITNPLAVDFTSNLPTGIFGDTSLVADAKNFTVGASIYFTPYQYYRIINNRKQLSHSAYPTFGLMTKMGFSRDLPQNNAFYQLSLSMKQGFQSRLLGSLDYYVEIGSFYGDKVHHFADYKHFSTAPTWIGGNATNSTFRALLPYERSTTDAYFQAHLHYEHARILLKRLPFLSGSLIRESLFVQHLMVENRKPWTEIGYGMKQLFFLFNVEVYTGFEAGKYKTAGIRLEIPIGQATIRM